MSAKTFAYASGCGLLAVDTFAAVAFQAPAEALQVDVIADAQQEKVYVQRYTRSQSGTTWLPASALSIQRLDEWWSGRTREAWLAGPGLVAYQARLPPETRLVRPEDWDPRPESLLQLALPRYQAGERDDLWALEPLYLRPSSAEEKWQARSDRP
jgi:tRNA threonylcarbamoyladenosine biosynthesis protein TsaB